MTNTEQKPNVGAIMAEIRGKILREVPKGQAVLNTAVRPPVTPRRFHEAMTHSEELHFLNTHWHNWGTGAPVVSHRRFLGRIIVKVKSYFVNLIHNHLLKDYFEHERQFQMHLVRYLNETAKRVDAANAAPQNPDS